MLATETVRQHETAVRRSDLSNQKSRSNHRLRRYRTQLQSLLVLKNLTPDQVQNFLDSYIIYNLDWSDEQTMIDTLGLDYQKRVGACLTDYYSVLNHLCALGELEKMYIPPTMDLQKSIIANQILYEETVARELLLEPGSKVLDLGCGRGRVAAHIARLTGAQVTGMNIDKTQLESAEAFNKECKLSNHFKVADFNDLPLPLPDNHFDGFYQIQAFSLAKDHTQLCRELYRVLKPGARVSLLDWASLDAYDPEDPHHQKLMRRIKPLIGAVGTPTPTSLALALETAGFRVLEMNNASIASDGLQAPLIERADGWFRHARSVILKAVRLRLAPQHFKTLFNRLTQDCDAFVEADRARLITTSYHWLAEKPLLTPDTEASSRKGMMGSLASSETAVDTAASDSPATSDLSIKPVL